jgi:hypothetical protein
MAEPRLKGVARHTAGNKCNVNYRNAGNVYHAYDVLLYESMYILL